MGRPHPRVLRRIHRAARRATAARADVRVDHRRRHVRVPQQLLHCADVAARLQQVRREAVPEGVRPTGFASPRAVPPPAPAAGSSADARASAPRPHRADRDRSSAPGTGTASPSWRPPGVGERTPIGSATPGAAARRSARTTPVTPPGGAATDPPSALATSSPGPCHPCRPARDLAPLEVQVLDPQVQRLRESRSPQP